MSARVNVNPEGEPLRPPRYDSPSVNPKGEPLRPRPRGLRPRGSQENVHHRSV